MNRFRIREEVRRIIRDPDFPKDDINSAINSVIASLNQLGRFKFHQGHQDLTLVLNQKDYTLTNFIAEDLLVFQPDTVDEDPVKKAPDLITPYSQGWFVTPGDQPKYYVIQEGKVWFEPIPNSTAAGKKVRVLGFFDLAFLASDLTEPSLPAGYHVSILAWGAASEIAPTMVVNVQGKSQTIAEVYNFNMNTMLKRENFNALTSHRIIRDDRWRNISTIGYVGRVR